MNSMKETLKEINFDEILKKTVIKGNYFNFEKKETYKIYHYSSLKIMEFLFPKSKNNNATLKLSKLPNCNDDHENDKILYQLNGNPNKIYLSCFTKESNENIHMWYMYGKDEYKNKCRFTFNQRALYELIKKDHILYYFKKNDNSKVYLNRNDYDIKMVKIAYIGCSNEFGDVSFKDKIIISGTMYNVDYSDVIKKLEKVKLSGIVKNIAWHNENEVRILLTLKVENTEIEEIYLELNDYIVEKEVLMSPWCHEMNVSFEGVISKKSIFTGKLDKVLPMKKCINCMTESKN